MLQRDLGIFELRQDADAALVIVLPVVGRPQLPRRAGEELRAEIVFEPGDRLGHGGHRHAELAGRSREAAGFGDANEDRDRLELVHRRGGNRTRNRNGADAAGAAPMLQSGLTQLPPNGRWRHSRV